MSKKFYQWVILMLVAASLNSCLFGRHGLIHDRSNDYLASPDQTPLAMPKNVSLVDDTPAYSIPNGPAVASITKPVSIIPPGFDSDNASAPSTATQQIQIAKVQGRVQLQISPADYDRAWTQVTAAVQKMGYQVMGSDKKNKMLEISGASANAAGSEVYELKFAQTDSAITVSVLSQTGTLLKNATAQPILEQLKQNM